MQYVRWYDKNPDLKVVFELIQKLDDDYRKVIAKDIMQMLMSDFDLDLDKEINKISTEYDFECKRWYDKNIDLFVSFEIIKNLPIEAQNVVVTKIMETALLICVKESQQDAQNTI